MKEIKSTYCLLILTLLVIVAGCKKDDDTPCDDASNPACPNYDPCYGTNPVSADFEFLARYGIGSDAEWISETKFPGSPIRFSALDKDADSYTWYLGLDTITGVDVVELDISDLPAGIYSAILVLENQPNLNCFPSDDGRDSTVHYFEKVDFCEGLFLGKFRGLEPTIDTDSIEIEIQFANINTGVICDDLYNPMLINVLGDDDTLFTSGGYACFSRIFFGGDGSGTLRGEIIVDKETLFATFDYRLGNVEYLFNGRKIE